MENAMSTEIWNTVDDYFSRELVKPDAALDAALKASAKAGLRAINVAPNQGKFLHLRRYVGRAGFSRSERSADTVPSGSRERFPLMAR
jgi:hypothetical protein